MKICKEQSGVVRKRCGGSFVCGGENVQLYHGDCLEMMDRLILKSAKVDMILADPPYGTTACQWDKIIPFEPMWERINKLIKPNGAIVFTTAQPFTSALISSNYEMFKYELIWHKPNGTGFLDAKRRPLRNHENIVIFCKKGTMTYNPQKWQGEPYNRGSSNKNSECYSSYTPSIVRSVDGMRYPNSIIFGISNGKKGGLHPTQKPVALLEYLVKTYTNEGETVLDFVMGSGSTGEACKNLSRDFIGIELDKTYFRTAKQRIDAINHA